MRNNTYGKNEATVWPIPNYWDAVALCLVIGIILALAWGAKQMTAPFQVGQVIPISLDPSHLPSYALRSVLRMFIAMICSLLFTFIFGTWAAKSKQAERVIIPMIDILQSVPVLSFLSLTVVGFITLFKGSLLGPECASIFAIFTAQVWNMTLSFYQSIRTVPADLKEAADVFRLSAWQRFWRIETPFALPGLLWNMMMSMSGSWFFVTAAEAISVQNITLPGIGSYIALALTHSDKRALVYALIAMLIVILLYDQLLFRPLVYWSKKFISEKTGDERMSRSWIVSLFQRTKLLHYSSEWAAVIFNAFVNIPLLNRKRALTKTDLKPTVRRGLIIGWNSLLSLIILGSIVLVARFIFTTVTLSEGEHVLMLGLATGTRVMVLIVISSLVWVPIGVWIGLRSEVAEVVQPIIQFLAAFPANLLFPVAAIVILKYHLDVNIWVAPLMVLGTQWYILFNVIAGASALPKDLRQAAGSFHVKGWLWWRRIVLPGIFPYFVTGAITAAGGAWNASIIAEVVVWGSTKLQAVGLGAYIDQYASDFPRLALGTVVMCLYVVVINRVLWRPLYNFATERFQLD